MAYATSNPPSLLSQRIANNGADWWYTDGDALALVIASGYFSDGEDLGLVVGDKIVFFDSTNGVQYDLVVDIVGATTTQVSLAGAQPGSVVNVTGATLAPTAAQSGTTFLLNRAAGITTTLPAPIVGLRYKFVVQTAVTSNDYGMDTDAGTTFLLGLIQQVIDANAVSEGQEGDGVAHVSLNMNGTTTGGLKGSYHNVECIDATHWMVDGIHQGSGTLATGFA